MLTLNLHKNSKNTEEWYKLNKLLQYKYKQIKIIKVKYLPELQV